MNTRLISLAVLLLGTATVQAAPVYECKDAQGRRYYSQTPGRQCQAANLSGAGGFYTSTPTTPSTATAEVSPPTAEVSSDNPAAAGADNSAQIQAAQRQLDAARQALEQGRQVRYGNERNYAKYLERIAGLEQAVRQSEQALQQLQQGAGN